MQNLAKDMETKIVRVFVGNLPPDTNEEELQSKIQKYSSVTSVEVKHRPDGVFAFVNLKDSETNLDKCFKKLSQKAWKGHQLRVQLAKESFLQRLARERLENEKNVSVSVDTQSTFNFSMHQGPAILNGSNITTRNNKSNNTDSESDTTDSSCDSSSKDRREKKSKKGCSQMLFGSKTFSEDQAEDPTPETNSEPKLRISTKKLNEEKEILEKFEIFNNVWKDTSSDESVEKPDKNVVVRNSEKVKKKQTLEHLKFGNREIEGKMNVSESHSNGIQHQGEKFKLKIEEAEKRRMKAMEDRQKELLKRKQVVKFALASVDNTSRPNKRILFTDDNDECISHGDYSKRNGNKKISLFDDEEMDCEMNDDFRIRNQFEGEKGQSLLALQARYGSDKRFTLDERFIESDVEEPEEENKVENADGECDTQAERERLLRILGTVLGKEIPNIDKTKAKYTTKPMLRYDPTKPDHVKFEIKPNSTAVKSKKKFDENAVDNSSATVEEASEKATDNLPVVSKEKYYRVSDTLQQTLQNSDQKFSLLDMFGNNENEKEADVHFNVKPIIKKKEWSLNPFSHDSSTSEDEAEERNRTIVDDYDKNIGVKQESLFFDKNDVRFIEGLDFINQINEEYMESFSKIRKDLKSIVKKKIMNNRKKAEKWKTKLGGKKNQIAGKRQKVNSR